MAINYALDEQDLSTHRFVNQISHGADKIDARLLQTQTTYAIDQARVVALGNPRYAGMPVNPLAIRLDLSLIGFEDRPGQFAKLVDNGIKSLSEQYKEGLVKPRSSDVSILYRVNDDELKSLIDSGLYADPRQFNRNLNLVSQGKEFSIPDRVRITTMQFQDTKYPGIEIGDVKPRPTYTLSSVQPSSNLTTFSQNTADNSFTSLFSDLTMALTQRRFHPEGQPNFVIAQAEQRLADHKKAVQQKQHDNQITNDITNEITNHVDTQPAVRNRQYVDNDHIRNITPETNDYQQHRLASQQVKPVDNNHKVSRLSDDDENHLREVLKEITNKAAREHTFQNQDASQTPKDNGNHPQNQRDLGDKD